MTNVLILQKKLEVLLNDLIYPTLIHFPKAEKFALCQEIKTCAYRMLRGSIQYQTALQRDRLYYLKQIDAELKYMLVLICTARNQHYITGGKALQFQEAISEAGRILGGLMKA